MGDNGAGKSTLIKMLSGGFGPTSGEIFVGGEKFRFQSPRDASAYGIGAVYQDLALAPLMSVSPNVFMERELFVGPEFPGVLDDKKMDRIALGEMRKIGIGLTSPCQPAGAMSGGERQTPAIARAICFGARALILDEPTSALGQ